jgi:hypothetical protein
MVNVISLQELLRNLRAICDLNGVSWYIINPRDYVHPEDLGLNPQTCTWRERYTVTCIRYNDDGKMFCIDKNIGDGIFDCNPKAHIYVGTWDEIQEN